MVLRPWQIMLQDCSIMLCSYAGKNLVLSISIMLLQNSVMLYPNPIPVVCGGHLHYKTTPQRCMRVSKVEGAEMGIR